MTRPNTPWISYQCSLKPFGNASLTSSCFIGGDLRRDYAEYGLRSVKGGVGLGKEDCSS